jgi:integrase
MSKPGWDADTARVNEQLIETHLIGKLGERPARELSDVELQDFMNGYVEAGSSKSLLAKLVMFLRAILKRAVKKQLIKSNPAEEVKARSRKKSSGLRHTSEECAALYSFVFGRDHLAVRILVELGLRSEELFALRRNDVCGDELVIDEAIPNGRLKETKTEASEASVFIPPDLAAELRLHLETVDASSTAWLFPSNRKDKPTRSGNFLNRVLKPAAIQARIALTRTRRGRRKLRSTSRVCGVHRPLSSGRRRKTRN